MTSVETFDSGEDCIVVFGGAGFIGTHLLRHLLALGQRNVICFDIPGFNWSLRVESRADRLTGESGAVLLREVLERTGPAAAVDNGASERSA